VKINFVRESVVRTAKHLTNPQRVLPYCLYLVEFVAYMISTYTSRN